MINYLKEFFSELDFSTTERVSLALAYEKIQIQKESRLRLEKIINGYSRDMNYVTADTRTEIERIAQCSGVHPSTAHLLTLILLTRKLGERLAGLGMTKKNILCDLSDLKYKMRESEMTSGIVGTDKWSWYTRYINPSIFALGRLEFEIGSFWLDRYEKDGKSVKLGDPVLKVHIPMSGEPLDPAAVASSYREAKKFFTRLLGTLDIPFTCTSWLLSPKNKEILGEKSNIVKFASKYDLISVANFNDNRDAFAWIFGVAKDTPIEKLPRDTTLRRGYAKLIEDGESLISGTGIFFLEDPKPKAPAAPKAPQ